MPHNQGAGLGHQQQRENFWLDVHSYKDPVGDFPFQLFSLGVLKMFYLPILNAVISGA